MFKFADIYLDVRSAIDKSSPFFSNERLTILLNWQIDLGSLKW